MRHILPFKPAKPVKLVNLVQLVALTLLAGAMSSGQSGYRFFSYTDDEAWLGVMVQDVTAKLAKKKGLKTEEGAYVSEVVEESPAEAAGILVDDVIVRFGDRPIYDGDDLIKAVRRSEPDQKVAVEVDRAGVKKTIDVTLDLREEQFSGPAVIAPPPHPRFDFFTPSSSHGLSLQKLGKQLAEYFDIPGKRGLLVTDVQKKSAADSAGFRAGDVITRINGVAVRDADDFRDEIREIGSGSVPVEIVRKGKASNLTLKVSPPGKSKRRMMEWYEDDMSELFEQDRGTMEILRERLSELTDELRCSMDRLRESINREILNL